MKKDEVIVTGTSITSHPGRFYTVDMTIATENPERFSGLTGLPIGDFLPAGDVIVKCGHCGQYAARKTACVHCGAPVD